jgi:transcriptional regulator with XRE-family HTH domain
MTSRQLGMRLKALRETRRLSQATLARRAKVTREYVNRLEGGRYDPTIGVLQRLARGLGVPVVKLLG